MPKRAAKRLHTVLAGMRLMLPAWLLYLLAGMIEHPLSLVLLLVANAVGMTAVCRAIGFDAESTFGRSIARRGLACFVLSTAYTAFVAALFAGPVWWLSRDGSLPAALTLSTASAVALFALWRIWPAFALPLLWDDAYPHDTERGSWLLVALRRSTAFARHLTQEHELFLGYGLPAGFGLLLLAAGALLLAGLGGFLSPEIRIILLALYAVVLAPLAHLLLANRCLRALLADARTRQRRVALDEHPVATPVPETAVLPAQIDQRELDATLLCAAHSAQTSLALAALDRGGDPNALPAPDLRDQRSVLMIAVTSPDLRLLRALIAKGADLNRMHGGITPLIAATRDSHEGRPEAITTLLANGADARGAGPDGNTALHHASRCAAPIVAALLLDAGADVNAVNAEGMTALGVACSGANWSVAAFLLDRGAKPQVESAQPSIVYAAGIAEDDPSGIKLLLKHRAAPDQRAALERTALMAAALAGNARIIEALLAAGAHADLADHRGTTALMEASRAGAVAVIHALGKRKADADRVDASGRTALMLACQSRHASEDAVRALLAMGADRAIAASDGKRALDHAAAAGRWHIVALLDPAYPLPSNLDGGIPPGQAAHADHLLDALRFGHWNVAAEFVGALGEWPQSALADIYLELVDAEHGQARTWLLNHGLGVESSVTTGAPLVRVLLERLPASSRALHELVARGAPVGGAGVLAQVLAAALADDASAETATLAHAFLDRGADWCASTTGQRSALHLAIELDDTAMISRLLDAGADPDMRDAQGRTPLHLAVARGDAAATRRLVAAGANPEIASATGETPLGLALARATPDLARWLTWTGWRLPLRRLWAFDLPAAASAGDTDAVVRLLGLGLPLDAVDAQGASALVRAAGSGHAGLVVHLLEAGADTSRVTGSGIHCLAAAVSARREAVVRTLLSHGVAADLRFAGGNTALILAAALGEVRIAEALLEAGADANAGDDVGATPLHAVAQYAFDGGERANARALFDLLLRRGARMDARDHAGQDVLLVLLGARAQPGTRCDAETLRDLTGDLLERGAAVDLQDQRGVSALHACALHGLSGCARLLKAHGAPLDQVDGFGRSAADVAALLGYVDVAAELDATRASVLPSVRQTLRRAARAPD